MSCGPQGRIREQRNLNLAIFSFHLLWNSCCEHLAMGAFWELPVRMEVEVQDDLLGKMTEKEKCRKTGGGEGPSWAYLKAEARRTQGRRHLCLPYSYELALTGPAQVVSVATAQGTLWAGQMAGILCYGSQPMDWALLTEWAPLENWKGERFSPGLQLGPFCQQLPCWMA